MLLQRFLRIPRVVASQIYSPGNIKGREGGGRGGGWWLVGRTNTGNPHSQSLSKYNEDSQSIYLSAYLCSDYFPLSSLIYDSPGYIVFPVECGPSFMHNAASDQRTFGTRHPRTCLRPYTLTWCLPGKSVSIHRTCRGGKTVAARSSLDFPKISPRPDDPLNIAVDHEK